MFFLKKKSTIEETENYEDKISPRTLFSLEVHHRKTQDFGFVGLGFFFKIGLVFLFKSTNRLNFVALARGLIKLR